MDALDLELDDKSRQSPTDEGVDGPFRPDGGPAAPLRAETAEPCQGMVETGITPPGASWPVTDSATSDRLVCTRCTTSNPANAGKCRKCNSYLLYNKDALQHGAYSKQPPPPDVQLRVDALRSGVIADRGGVSELTTLETSYIEKLGDIDTTIQLLMHDIAVNGLLTPGGRVRGVYDKLLAGLAAFDRYAQRIGLERRSRPVPSLQEVLAGHDD